MRYLIVVLVLLLGCSTNNEVALKQVNSIAGEWTFKGTTAEGTFMIENNGGDLYVASGSFTVNGGYTYDISIIEKVTETKILLKGKNGYLALLKYSVLEDYNTIMCPLFEYDTEVTPTITKTETVIITRSKP
jgi:hypothetical protein